MVKIDTSKWNPRFRASELQVRVCELLGLWFDGKRENAVAILEANGLPSNAAPEGMKPKEAMALSDEELFKALDLEGAKTKKATFEANEREFQAWKEREKEIDKKIAEKKAEKERMYEEKQRLNSFLKKHGYHWTNVHGYWELQDLYENHISVKEALQIIENKTGEVFK